MQYDKYQGSNPFLFYQEKNCMMIKITSYILLSKELQSSKEESNLLILYSSPF